MKESTTNTMKSTTTAMESTADATKCAIIPSSSFSETSADATKSATDSMKSSANATDAMEFSATATETPADAMKSSANATESAKTASKSTTNAMESSANSTESGSNAIAIATGSATNAINTSADSMEVEISADNSVFLKSTTNTMKSTTTAMDSIADATKCAIIPSSSFSETSAGATKSATDSMKSSANATDAMESSATAMESSATATVTSADAMESSANATESAKTATKSTTNAMESSANSTESGSNAIAIATGSATNAINTSADSMEVEISADNSVFLISEKLGPKIRIDSPKCFIKDPNEVLNKSKCYPVQSLNREVPNQGFHQIPKKYTTPPIIPKKLPAVFERMTFLSSFQQSNDKVDRKKVLKEFVGSGLDDETFDKLEMYCKPEHLKSGLEIELEHPYLECANRNSIQRVLDICAVTDEGKQLNTVVKTTLRNQMDKCDRFKSGLVYRGIRFCVSDEEKTVPDNMDNLVPVEPPLVPGKDLIFKIRIYKPFPYNPKKKIEVVSRHPILSHDLIIHGRQSLEVVRDQFRCANDLGLRVDASHQRYQSTSMISSCREIFPSAFMFINNVFYDDTRPGCKQHSAVIREWASRRGMGVFPAKPLNGVQLQDLEVRLGYPEVFVHQGDCEHLFSFSQVRLVGPDDVLDPSRYPTHRTISNSHLVYCTTCAEFVAKWIVVGSDRTPFDPAFFCDTCFPLYMYKNEEKIGDFKAYPYIVNDTCKY